MKQDRLHEIAFALVGLFGLAGAGCINELPSVCPDGMALITFRGFTEADPAVRRCVDVHAAARRDATFESPGRDNSFGLGRPGVIPWTKISYEEAGLACGRAGKFLCDARTLRSIGPDPIERPPIYISSLQPNTVVEDLADQFQELDAPAERSNFAFPETWAAPAYWTDEGEIFGRIRGDVARTGADEASSPMLWEEDFRHPLLGFRCCVDVRVTDLLEPLPEDPALVMEEEDDVPIAR